MTINNWQDWPWHWVALGLLIVTVVLLFVLLRKRATAGLSSLSAWFHHLTARTTPAAPATPVATALAVIPVVDVTSGAFIDRDDFMKAIAHSTLATWLDGTLVHSGITPGVNFYTQSDGKTISNGVASPPIVTPTPATPVAPVGGAAGVVGGQV